MLKKKSLILLKEKSLTIFLSHSPLTNSCVGVSGLQLGVLVHGLFPTEKDPSLQSERDVDVAQI